MIMGREDHVNEELRLILSSLDELMDRAWSTVKLRAYAEGDPGVLEDLWRAITEFGLFRYPEAARPSDLAVVTEKLSSKLPPGIVLTTFIGVAVTEDGLGGEKYEGKIKVSISGSPNLAPEAHRADVILLGDRLVWRSNAEVKPLDSLDNSMKWCRVNYTGGTGVGINKDLLNLLLAASIVGVGEVPVRMAVEYAKKRIAFGKPIGSFQAVKHRLVDMALQVELARSLYLRAAEDLRLASMAKDYAARTIPNVIRGSIQVYGGIGFTDEVDLHLYLRRSVTLGKVYEVNPSQLMQAITQM
jgi:hypothetical protein